MACDETHPLPCAEADWPLARVWTRYTASVHSMWDHLFARQSQMLPGRVTSAFLQGLEILRLSKPGFPDFDELNERLHRATGWTVVALPGLLLDAMFFEHISQRRFVAGRFIRTPDRQDYLKESDILRDVFGHFPLLANPVFADYMQACGKGGSGRSIRNDPHWQTLVHVRDGLNKRPFR